MSKGPNCLIIWIENYFKHEKDIFHHISLAYTVFEEKNVAIGFLINFLAYILPTRRMFWLECVYMVLF